MVTHERDPVKKLAQFFFKTVFWKCFFSLQGGSVGRDLLVINGVKWGNGQKSMDIHHHLFERRFSASVF